MKLSPKLLDGAYEYATIKFGEKIPDNAIAMIKEHEAITIIVPTDRTDGDIWAWIVNDTVTDLYATGITASFSKALNEARIPCNVIAAYYHDHILVPYSVKDKAVVVLSQVEV